MAILWHELALLVLGALVVALTWGGANHVGACTFATLWVMRLSAKLNVFLGVRNLQLDFLPPHLRYLGSYFRHRPSNRLFPVSMLLSGGVAVALWGHALAPGRAPFDVTATVFLATLLTLAVLEHAFMMLPLPAERLWRWGLRSREAE